MSYAIIRVGGKQHRVREGEYLLVDRLPIEAGKTFKPEVLLIGGDGETLIGDDLKGTSVSVRVAEHVKGKKLVIGKHRRRTGYPPAKRIPRQPLEDRGRVDRGEEARAQLDAEEARPPRRAGEGG